MWTPFPAQRVRRGGFPVLQWIPATALALGLSGSAAFAEPESKPKKTNHVTVQAFADRQAITPGQTLHLIVSLKMEKDWYVYWQNPGGTTGLPTKIRWTAPDGYKLGRVRFPVPEIKFDKVLKETNYIHQGTGLFLVPVQVPEASSPGEEARFTVKASWLVCSKTGCIPGRAEVSLMLPVAAPGTPAKPANEKLFQRAREALPEPITKAEHVKLSHSIDKEVVKPGDKFTAALTAEIEAKHHMQSHKPFQKELIPAVVLVELADGLDIGEVVYPKPHVHEDKILGKLSDYSGKVVFKFPVEVDEDADKRLRWIRGVLQYQICNDAGICFLPQHIEFAIPMQMEGGAQPAKEAVLSAGAVEDGRTFLARAEDWFEDFGYIGVLVMALIGGIVLNLMPCVLPVISLKILSFVRQAKEDRARVFVLGLAYCAGILVFFSFLGILFWTTGRSWGQLFQNPYIVLALAAIVTAFAMSLFGLFAVFTPKVINKLGEKAEGEGLLSSFFTGVLATFLGTACTAPFLSAAVGLATKFEPYQGALIFFAVGVGMALPFFILAAQPGWLKYVPQPGPWMGTFEWLMGFLLLGTVIWLLNPLRGQLGDYGLLLSLIFLLAVAIAVWIKGKVQFGDPIGRKLRLHALALLVLIIGWCLPFRVIGTIPNFIDKQIELNKLLALGEEYQEIEAQKAVNPGNGNEAVGVINPQALLETLERVLAQTPDPSTNNPDHVEPSQVLQNLIDDLKQAAAESNTGPRKLDWSKGIPWRYYRRSRVMRDVKRGYTVFVDYTAGWCLTCKVNLKTSIDHPEVITLMREYNVIPYEADYTLPVPEIKEDLKRFEKAGVPLYLVYKPWNPDDPEKLPEILTPGVVIDALKRAGPSKVGHPPTSQPAESD